MSGRGRGEGARRGPPPPLGRFAGRPQKACVYNMKKLLSTFPSTFKKKKKLLWLRLGVLDVKRLPTYDTVELEKSRVL